MLCVDGKSIVVHAGGIGTRKVVNCQFVTEVGAESVGDGCSILQNVGVLSVITFSPLNTYDTSTFKFPYVLSMKLTGSEREE